MWHTEEGKLHAAGCKPQLQAAGYMQQATSHRPQAASHKPQARMIVGNRALATSNKRLVQMVWRGLCMNVAAQQLIKDRERFRILIQQTPGAAAALSGAGTSSVLGARSLGGATARTALVTGLSSATGAMCTWWARGAAFPSQPTGGRQRIMYIGGCAWHLDGLHHASGRLRLSTAALEMETGLFF